MRPGPLSSLSWLLLGAALLGCGEGRQGPRNVVVVLVDTLRADHLGAYGYGRDTSPNLDAWARSAVLFEDARSQWACTFPSVNSLLTSLPPARFLGGAGMGLPPGVPTLPGVLRARGYRTVAVSASPIVRASPSRFNPDGGFGADFDVFREGCAWSSAACVNGQAFAELEGLPEPFFLYLHYMEPHGPYRPPAEHARRWAAPGTRQPWVERGDPDPISSMLYKGAPDPGASAADVQHLVDLYDEEIAYFDSQFAALLAGLGRGGRLERTLVALVADHGEEFLEHGDVKHCRNAYDTTVRTPFILSVPGVPAARLAAGAQNLDLVPTLLDYLDVPLDGHGFAGRSLRPAVERGTRVNAFQFAGQGDQRAVADGRYKLIEDLGERRAWLYDLVEDPAESRDVLAESRRAYGALHAALRDWLAQTEGGEAGPAVALARETEQRLRALGYLE